MAVFGRKPPTEFETSVTAEIDADVATVFAVIDPASPDHELRQQGFHVEAVADAPDRWLASHPSLGDEVCELEVVERRSPYCLEVRSERLSHGPLPGALMGDTTIYRLRARGDGGSTLELRTCARFHPKAKGEYLRREHAMFATILHGESEKIRAFAELPPAANVHHPLHRIGRFWTWFVDNEQPLRGVGVGVEDAELLAELGRRLGEADAALSFELRDLEDGRREFAVHADGMREAFPMVEMTAAAAPRDALPRWRIVAFKQPKGPLNGATIMGSQPFDTGRVRYRLEPPNESGTRDITLYFENYTRRSRETFMEFAFLVLDHCLGEHRTATAIGEIEFETLAKADGEAKPIDRLAHEFED